MMKYADDTNLLLFEKDWENLRNTVKTKLINVNTWIYANKLSLNVQETIVSVKDNEQNCFYKTKKLFVCVIMKCVFFDY